MRAPPGRGRGRRIVTQGPPSQERLVSLPPSRKRPLPACSSNAARNAKSYEPAGPTGLDSATLNAVRRRVKPACLEPLRLEVAAGGDQVDRPLRSGASSVFDADRDADAPE